MISHLILALFMLVTCSVSFRAISGERDSSHDLKLKTDSVPQSKVVVISGSDVVIQCPPIASQLRIESTTWLVNESEVNQSYVLDTGSLSLRKARISDQGEYTCVSHFGKEAIVSIPIIVNVTDRTQFWKEIPSNLSIPFGSAVRLGCSSNYLEDFELCSHAEVKWLKDGSYIEEDDEKYMTSKCAVLHILSLEGINEGSYRCELTLAVNGQRLLSPAGYIKIVTLSAVDNESTEVEGWMHLRPRPPLLLLNSPSVVEVIIGQVAVLECLSNDAASVTPVKWSTADKSLLRRPGVFVEKGGSLVISRVTAENEGMYKCSLTLASEDDIGYRFTRLSVLRPPALLAFPSPKELPSGNLVRFNCSAAGVPPPTVHLFKDGIPYAEGNSLIKTGPHRSSRASNTTIVTFVILIVQQHDEGIYQCVARNLAGATTMASKMTWMRNGGAPGSPINVRVKDSNSTSILFQWRPPKYLGKKSEFLEYNYDAFFGRADSNQHTDEVLGFDVVEKRYSKLQPNTNYTFYIRVLASKNESVEMSELTDRIYHVTSKDSPIIVSPTTSLTVISPSVLKVQWSAFPSQLDGMIWPVSLTENYRKVKQKIQWWNKNRANIFSSRLLNYDVREYNITGIPAATTEVRVLVKYSPSVWNYFNNKVKNLLTIVEYSEWSKSSSQNSADVANQQKFKLFLSTNDSTSVLIEWDMPEKIQEDLQYNLTYINILDERQRMSTILRAPKHYLVGGLEDSSCYRFFLSVFSSGLEPLESEARICINLNYSTFIEESLDNNFKKHLKHEFQDEEGSNSLFIWRVDITNLTSDSITLQWTPSENTLADFFLITYDEIKSNPDLWKIDPGTSTGIPVTPTIRAIQEHKSVGIGKEVAKRSRVLLTNTKIVLTDLKPRTTYRIILVPSTVEKVGEPTSPVFVTTLDGEASAPRGFKWTPITTSSANVSWSPPLNSNGKLIQYQILYSHDLLSWKNVSVPAEITHVTLHSLISNINYVIRISGITGFGPGKFRQEEISIQAVLDRPFSIDQLSLGTIIIFIIVALVIITCFVLTYLMTVVYRVRRKMALGAESSSRDGIAFGGSGVCSERDSALDIDGSIDNQPISDQMTSLEGNSTVHVDAKGRQINLEEAVQLLQKTPLAEVTPFRNPPDNALKKYVINDVTNHPCQWRPCASMTLQQGSPMASRTTQEQ